MSTHSLIREGGVRVGMSLDYYTQIGLIPFLSPGLIVDASRAINHMEEEDIHDTRSRKTIHDIIA